MNDHGLVSILIPVFNRKDFIGPCVESALSQTYENVEIVVVDNASTDGTWEACLGLEARDSRVRAFRNPENIGPVRNWMRCLEEARGRFVKFLFSDDLVHRDFVSRTLPLLADDDTAFVYTGTVIGPDPWTGSRYYFGDGGTGRLDSREFVLKALYGNRVPVSPGCALFRAEDVRRNLRQSLPEPYGVDFSARGAGADQLLYLLTAVDYRFVQVVAEPLSFFRAHSGTITARTKRKGIREDYLMARIWLANTRLDRRTALIFNAFAWIRLIRHRRRIVSPASLLPPGERRSLFAAGVIMFLFLWPIMKGKYGRLGSRQRERFEAGSEAQQGAKAPLSE